MGRPGEILRAAGVALVLLVGLWRLSGAWPGPGLPPHATRLNIVTAAPQLLPALACPGALLGPVRVATAGEELVVVLIDSGKPVPVIWPSGWAAWRLSGRAELVNRGGAVVGREGDLVQFGGGENPEGVFRVCEIGW
jgi:hypothetical protein